MNEFMEQSRIIGRPWSELGDATIWLPNLCLRHDLEKGKLLHLMVQLWNIKMEYI